MSSVNVGPSPGEMTPDGCALAAELLYTDHLSDSTETNAHRRVAPVARRQPCARIRTIATAFRTSSTFLPASRD